MKKKRKWGVFFSLVLQVVYATDATWTGRISSDLNTGDNWVGGVVPMEVATFNSKYPSVVFNPTATGTFTINNIYFPRAASPFQFTFTNTELMIIGTGITGLNTNTQITNNNSINIHTPQIYFNLYEAGNSFIGSASFIITNSGLGSIMDGLNNGGQLVFGDSDGGAVGPIEGDNDVVMNISNTNHAIINGANEAGQIFSKRASITLGDNLSVTVLNNHAIVESNSDTGQMVFDAALDTANFTAGNYATFNFTNESNGQIQSIGGGNNVGQVLFDGQKGIAAFTVGDHASFTLINEGSGLIFTEPSGDDAGQMVFAGNSGTASFQAGDYLALILTNENSSTIAGNGFDTAQIVVDGDGGVASFQAANYASFNLNNTNATIIGGDDGNDVGQIVIDGDNGIASFSTGNYGDVTLINDGSVRGFFNVGQIVVDGVTGTSSMVLGDNCAVNLTNNGLLSSIGEEVYVAQIAVVDGVLSTGSGVTITATNADGADILNSGGIEAAQIYFHDATITGTPTITAINQYPILGSIYGIFIDGDSSADQTNFALQNASFVLKPNAAEFSIASLAGDGASVVNLFKDLQINTLSGSSATFAGVISGGRGVTITGLGTEVLSGANTYTGPTTVNGGTFVLNGSVAGDITTANGSTFKGTGTVNGSATISGVLSPGNSIGTIHLGSLTLNPSSNTYIEIDPTATSLVDVVGSATLSGGLTIFPDEGIYPKNAKYTILTATSIADIFDSLTIPFGFLASLDYTNPQAVVLDWQSLQIPMGNVTGENNISLAKLFKSKVSKPHFTTLFIVALSVKWRCTQ